MSAIHKALQSANSRPQAGEHNKYNPLSAAKSKNLQLPLSGLSALLLLLTGLVLFWPVTATVTVSHPVISTEKPAENPQPASTQTDIVRTTAVNTKQKTTDQVNDTPQQAEPLLAKPTQIQTTQQPVAVAKASVIPPTSRVDTLAETKVTPVTVPVKEKTRQTKAAVTAAATVKETQISKQDNEAAVDVNPGIRQSVNTWQQQTQQHLANGEIEQAEALLKNWIAALPNDAQPRIWLARIYINNEVYRAAEPLLVNLSSAQAKALLGVIYERTSRPESAVKIFAELYRSQPANYRWLLFWAINSENAGQLAKANALYQTYLQQFSLDDMELTAFVQQRLRNIQGQ